MGHPGHRWLPRTLALSPVQIPIKINRAGCACNFPGFSGPPDTNGAHDRDRTGEPLPYQGSALPTELRGPDNWSGKRDSNPQPSAWKADALAIELFPLLRANGGEGRIRTSEGCAGRFTVCSLWPLGNLSRLKKCPPWSWRWDSNPQPADYKSAALPLSYASIASPTPQARTAHIITYKIYLKSGHLSIGFGTEKIFFPVRTILTI